MDLKTFLLHFDWYWQGYWVGFGKLFRGEHLCKVYNLQTNTTILARKVRNYKGIRYIDNTTDAHSQIFRYCHISWIFLIPLIGCQIFWDSISWLTPKLVQFFALSSTFRKVQEGYLSILSFLEIEKRSKRDKLCIYTNWDRKRGLRVAIPEFHYLIWPQYANFRLMYYDTSKTPFIIVVSDCNLYLILTKMF